MRAGLPWLVALATAIVIAVLGWQVVRPDVESFAAAGVWTDGPFRFVGFFAVLGAGVAFWITRRGLNGPTLARDDWSLFFPGAAAGATVGQLQDRLERRGYRLRIVGTGGADVAPAGQPLVGAPLRISAIDARARHGFVLLGLSPAQGERDGLGLIEVHDLRGIHHELTQYLIVALGELLPGLRFKRLASALEPESPAELAALLPARAERLPRLG